MATSSARKRSTVRHTRAIQRDRIHRVTPAPPPEQVATRLTDLIAPATFAQVAAFHAAGCRSRILTLPVMVAFVLSLIWRQIGSVREAVRVLNQEGFLWTSPTPVSPQALNQRLRILPPALFQAVLDEVLPAMQARAAARQRPLPPVLAWADQHFAAVLSFDGSTLDALVRQTGLLRDGEGPVLAGRMAGLLNVTTRLPQHLWYEPDSAAHDQRFWERAEAVLPPGALLLIDLGFWNYEQFDRLTARQVWFVSRVKANAVWRVERGLRRTATVRESLIRLGATARPDEAVLRLVELYHEGRWRRYVTNVTDPAALPAAYVPLLYAERWRIEEAFNLVKRLLGLAYSWSGAENAIQIQVWATWLLYAVLQDLTDEVAAGLGRPVGAVSVEMVFRALYHYTQASQHDPTLEVVAYLVRKADELDLLKAQWRPPASLPAVEPLDFSAETLTCQ
jgi:Transposase DDE domain